MLVFSVQTLPNLCAHTPEYLGNATRLVSRSSLAWSNNKHQKHHQHYQSDAWEMELQRVWLQRCVQLQVRQRVLQTTKVTWAWWCMLGAWVTQFQRSSCWWQIEAVGCINTECALNPGWFEIGCADRGRECSLAVWEKVENLKGGNDAMMVATAYAFGCHNKRGKQFQ